MKRSIYLVAGILVIALLMFALSCGGGGSVSTIPGDGNTGGAGPSQDDGTGSPQDPQLPEGSPISLLISATPSSGAAPLEVNLFVSATGGREPYEYAWDFENDGIFDSTSQTPYHTYNVTSVAMVRVTDADGSLASGYRTILVNGQAPSGETQPLVALFGMNRTAGPVPLLVNFEGFASGGTPPYNYRWDFDNDGSFDSFVQNPFFTYEVIGTPVDADGSGTPEKWVYYPTLEVVDAIGRTNAFNAEINVYPASSALILSAFANPPTGQAPLRVTFDGGAEGGVAPYEYKWDFGEGEGTGWKDISQAEHTYVSPGIYQALFTVRDSEGLEVQSGLIEVRVEEAQQIGVVIMANVVNASVPFSSNFTSEVSGGKEPYEYTWVVYSNSTVTDDATNPSRSLVGSAIVTPNSTNVPNPDFHFASVPLTPIQGGGVVYDPIIVQLVVTDALGSEAVSNAITMTPQAASFSYDALKPETHTFVGKSPNYGNQAPEARSNPAVTTHPFLGITFMFGGDKVDTAGVFEGIVELTQSAWAYNPNGEDPAGDSPTGYQTGFHNNPVLYPANSWIELNATSQSPAGDGTLGGIGGGAFPVGPMRYMTPARTSLRADDFVPRGNACAIFTHEPVETNPEGADYAGCVAMAGIAGNFSPDDPNDRGLDSNGMNGPGYGVPVIYVIGGRDENGIPLTTVQKYYPPGFGTELLPIDCLELCGCVTGDFQITNNQVDIWRNNFLGRDRDYWPQVGEDPRIPIVPDCGG